MKRNECGPKDCPRESRLKNLTMGSFTRLTIDVLGKSSPRTSLTIKRSDQLSFVFASEYSENFKINFLSSLRTLNSLM